MYKTQWKQSTTVRKLSTTSNISSQVLQYNTLQAKMSIHPYIIKIHTILNLLSQQLEIATHHYKSLPIMYNLR